MDRIDLTRRAADAANLAADRERAIALARDAAARLDARARPGPRRAGAGAAGPLPVGRGPRGRGGGGLPQGGRHAAGRSAQRRTCAGRRCRGPAAHAPRPRHEAIARCEEALAVARAVGARAEEGQALNTLGACRSGLGEHEAAEASLREALAIALELKQFDDIGRAYVNLSDCDRPGRPDRRGRAARARRRRGGPVAGARHRLPRDAAGRGGAPHASAPGAGTTPSGWRRPRAPCGRAGSWRAARTRPSPRSRRRAAIPPPRRTLSRVRARCSRPTRRRCGPRRSTRGAAELELSAGRATAARDVDLARPRASARARSTRSSSHACTGCGLRAEAELAEEARAQFDEPAERDARARAADLVERIAGQVAATRRHARTRAAPLRRRCAGPS